MIKTEKIKSNLNHLKTNFNTQAIIHPEKVTKFLKNYILMNGKFKIKIPKNPNF